MEKIICTICGMEINLKNYYINNEGILNNNSSEIFNCCPFCGVSKEYFTTDKVINDSSNALDDNTLKILDHAMKLEVFNGEFYKQAAFIAKDDKNKRMFNALSKIEMMHAKIHQKLGGFKELPVLKEMNYSKYKGDNTLLELASKREEHAVEYYTKYYREVKAANIKNVFKALSQVEKEHITLTLTEINK